MNLLSIIIISLAIVFVASILFYIVYGKLTEHKFNIIADKFKQRFGYTPFSITVGKSGGFFFWGYKESYIMCALIFTRFPVTKRTLTQEEISFFKDLKMSEISWFYIKYTSIIISLLSFISLLIILKMESG